MLIIYLLLSWGSLYYTSGTGKGDPTEANWVGEQFVRDDELLIGSVKGNIGCVLFFILINDR